MHFTIVTPSFNQLDFLRRCIASVADQVGSHSDQPLANSNELTATSLLSVCHHIQDGESTDGTREFLAEQLASSNELMANGFTFTYESAPDTGMYDALNRGVKLAIDGARYQALGPGEKLSANSQKLTAEDPDSIIAWLNCDEQYLPRTLEFVGEYFDRHPEVDILYGDYLMVDEEGELLSFRKGATPRLWYIQASHLNNLSCTLFFRARVFEALGGFDTQYKAVADEDFIVRALQAGFRARHVRRYFSIFTFTGSNLGGGVVGREEFASLKKDIPLLLKWFAIPLNLSRWIEKLLGGTYFQKFPIEYEIYLDDADRRTRLVSSKVGWKWPSKVKP